MVTCPICGNEIGELPRTGDAEGFDCKQHGKFKVSRTSRLSRVRAPGAIVESAARYLSPVELA